MGRNIGAAVIGAAVVLAIYHFIFVLKPVEWVKEMVGTEAAKVDTVRRGLGVMEKRVGSIDQKVSEIEVLQDVQKQSLDSIVFELDELRRSNEEAIEKANLAVKLTDRAKTAGSPGRKTKGPKVKADKPGTLLAKLLEGQNRMVERVDKLNKRLDEQEREAETGEESVEKEDSAKSRARLSAKTGKSWKNSFAF